MALLLKCFKASLIFPLLISFSTSTFAQEATAPKFKKVKAKIGGVAVTLEVADSPERHAYGLMYREKLEKNSGMVFIFDSEEYRHFWMQNTFIDLSIGFFNAKKELIEVIEMEKKKSVVDKGVKTYASTKPAKYAVEMNKSWFSRNKIKSGSKLDISQ